MLRGGATLCEMQPLQSWSLRLCALSAFFLADPTNAYACRCKFPPNAKAAAPYATDVFEAVPLGAPSTSPSGTLPQTATYEFEVGRVMKGAAKGTVKVITNLSSAACGRSYKPGETYILYAQRDGEMLTDGACSFTATKAKAVMRGDYSFWGDGPPPARTAAVPTDAPPTRPPAEVAPPIEPTTAPEASKPAPETPVSPVAPSTSAAPASSDGCAVVPSTRNSTIAWVLVVLCGWRRRRSSVAANP